MPAELDDETITVIPHRGLPMQLTCMPDQDGATPEDDGAALHLTPEQVSAWHLGEWYFYSVLVKIVDPADEEEWVEFDGNYCSFAMGCVPSFVDASDVIYAAFDNVADQFAAQNLEPSSHDVAPVSFP
jgi:hypothetical protein